MATVSSSSALVLAATRTALLQVALSIRDVGLMSALAARTALRSLVQVLTAQRVSVGAVSLSRRDRSGAVLGPQDILPRRRKSKVSRVEASPDVAEVVDLKACRDLAVGEPVSEAVRQPRFSVIRHFRVPACGYAALPEPARRWVRVVLTQPNIEWNRREFHAREYTMKHPSCTRFPLVF
jgi:hypothetical protein